MEGRARRRAKGYSWTRDCTLITKKEYNAKYYRDHKEEKAKYRAIYYQEHKEKAAIYYQEHKEERTIYLQKNMKEMAKYQVIYQREHKEENNKRRTERRKNDIQFRMACNLRSRMVRVAKNKCKSGSAIRDLGCSIGQFRLYIENQFELGMTWDNYGEWHLDHIQPLSSFNLEDRSEFITASNWLNYQPLWGKDNISKGNR